MALPAKTAVYLRQSVEDSDGIDRQRAIVYPLCSARGWSDLEEYVDNDESATPERRKRPRRDFTRLWADIEKGRVARVDSARQPDRQRVKLPIDEKTARRQIVRLHHLPKRMRFRPIFRLEQFVTMPMAYRKLNLTRCCVAWISSASSTMV